MRQIQKAGEKAFVDYCGPIVPVVNASTGEMRTGQIFVGVLGASNYTYQAELAYNSRLLNFQEVYSMSMSVERTLFAFGGTMVMATSLLALFHHPYWTWFTLFIGFNCFQSSFTGFCPPSWLMKKFGLKTEAELAMKSSS